MLLVETEARGTGLGAKLIDECVAFARAKGYMRLILWTYNVLEGARRLYKRAGFQIVKVFEKKEIWGQQLIEEVWELIL
jgi:GNAT superfamily N-acetyltransferase